MNKKVLIVTYYWPPSGGSGVQRWLKFVKYLPSFGWEPHVLTPENPSFQVRDPSLERDVPNEAEVLRLPIWEPYEIFERMTRWFGSSKKSTSQAAFLPGKNKSLFQRISTWVRGNFFIPDPRVFWVRPSVKFLSDYIKDNRIKIIVTTGPPHSMHLIGLRLKRKYPHLRWLADFRDPWSDWGMWDSLNVSGRVRKIHRKLENNVLTHADEIITITPFYVRRFEVLSGRKVRLLTNGFDEEDFSDVVRQRPPKFVIRHVGWINDRCNPRPFMAALKEEMLADKVFAAQTEVEFIGEVHPEFQRYVAASSDLQAITRFTGNIPHADLLRIYGTSALLLLVLTGYKDAEGFLPGKLFEYLATGLPVVGVGPAHGDAAEMLKETGAGVMIESDDHLAIRKAIREVYERWRSGSSLSSDADKRSQYSRRVLAEKLSLILEESPSDDDGAPS